jgi:hypothetical protein
VVALTANPANSEAQVYRGLSYEGLAYYDSARAVYNHLLASQVDGRTRRLLSGRIAILTHVELQRAAREAIAGESLLARTPPDPNTVAVMPFRSVGTDTTYRPLERGLAALVVTDLSRVRRLRLVERARVQVLLDELKLAETGQRAGWIPPLGRARGDWWARRRSWKDSLRRGRATRSVWMRPWCGRRPPRSRRRDRMSATLGRRSDNGWILARGNGFAAVEGYGESVFLRYER